LETYIAFLRGINVGGQKKIKMADLRQSLATLPVRGLETYIQSGNLIFESEANLSEVLEADITSIIKKQFGFEVPVLVRTITELKDILKANPFLGKAHEQNLYFVLLHTEPDQDMAERFDEQQFEHEDFHRTRACVYLNCFGGYGKAKLTNNLIEKKLGVVATARNFKTMNKMLEMAEKSQP